MLICVCNKIHKLLKLALETYVKVERVDVLKYEQVRSDVYGVMGGAPTGSLDGHCDRKSD